MSDLYLWRRKPTHSWRILGTHAGRRVDKGTGTRDRKAAEAIKDKYQWNLQQREIFGPESVATFAEAAIGYMNTGGERRFLTKILERIGKVKLKDMNQLLIDDTGREVYPHVKPATLRRQWHGPINAVLRYAARAELMPRKEIQLPKASKGKVRWISPEDANKIIQAHTAPHIPVFGFGTGCRASEMARLVWDDVDLRGGEALIRKSKNGDQRLVELPLNVVAALSTLPQREGHVFLTRKGQPYKVNDTSGGLFNDGLATACESAGVDKITAHVMRHTFATWFYAEQKDLIRLKRLGGWSKLEMLEVYTHLAPMSLPVRLHEAGWTFDREEIRERMRK